ncbi:enoyl-CoA hydratase/isomerase family protein [Microbacterium karelineae]|uniref:enoyl-CoA hydratase/isomerase family protein n=1 Tax=Microbacterium karelineae TaxID=2654283 RepID=UPI0018D42865|nr:enoyl-CoA hydratase/isomerase family protein [Microbacterium karelineae]
MTPNDVDERILIRTHSALGRITIDRPRSLGAVDTSMLRAIGSALDAWRDDADIDTVLIDATSDRGFCAGGDVRRLHGAIMAGDTDLAEEFFRVEYRLDAALAEYPKPIVAFADGVTMGGGIGLAGQAAVRIVTETSVLAMPETRIGFTPDAGGSWLLAHAPGRVGEYLALTSDTMNAADAIYAGFADQFVRRADLEAVRDALETRADPSTPTELVMLFDETPDESDFVAARAWIDDAFARDSVAEVRGRLRELAGDPRWRDAPRSPAAALAALDERPPVALAVTLAAIRSSRALPNLRAALEQEFRLVDWFVHTQPDMLEGIRAQMIDRDASPRWSPATLGELPADIIGRAFAHEPAAPLFA